LEFLSSRQRPRTDAPNRAAEAGADPNTDGGLGGLSLLSPLSYDMAMGYIRECPAGETIPAEAASLLGAGWEFSGALWKASRLMAEPGASLRDACGKLATIDSVTKTGESLMHASCDFSVLLDGFDDFFRCENWYRLYEEGMYDAVCYSGVSGFLWIAITQSIIVVLSLTMLTIRIGCFCNEECETLRSVAGDGSQFPQDTTMITEDDEDDEVDGGVPVPNPYHFAPQDSNPMEWGNREKWDATEWGAESVGRAAPRVNVDQGPRQHPRSEGRGRHSHPGILRSTGRNREKNQGNHLPSTSLYSIGASAFEKLDEESPNVEVCLGNPFNPSHAQPVEEGFWGGNPWSGTDEAFGDIDFMPIKPPAKKASRSSSPPAATAENISEEVFRVRERLKDIKERRENHGMR